jgi:8-oxo-dGTP diphosphatase
MDAGTIRIVAALIRDDAGRVLLVRKRGTTAFMQPGGKRDAGEDDIAALSREVAEGAGPRLDPAARRVRGDRGE